MNLVGLGGPDDGTIDAFQASGSGSREPTPSLLVPLVGLLVAIVSWGTFAIPMKLPAVQAVELSPFVFQLYMSIGIMLSSWVVLIWEPWVFTLWSIPAAVVWTTGSILSVVVIKDIGLSIGQGMWSGFVALTAFLWGLLGHSLLPGHFPPSPMRDVGMATVGLLMLMAGVLGLSLTRGFNAPNPGAGTGGLLPEEQFGSINQAQAAPVGFLVRGMLCAVLVGVCFGSTLVPMKMAAHTFQVAVRLR